jgi:hypothetical protein
MQPDQWMQGQTDPWNYKSKLIHPQLPVSFITGIESDVPKEVGPYWTKFYCNPLQLVQWTMASAPNHTILIQTVEKIVLRVQNAKADGNLTLTDVTFLTGPGPWTEAIHESWKKYGIDWNELRGFGSKGRVIGDQLVLPIFGFA